MQNSSEYPDHLSVLSRALWCFFPTTFLERAVNKQANEKRIQPKRAILYLYNPSLRFALGATKPSFMGTSMPLMTLRYFSKLIIWRDFFFFCGVVGFNIFPLPLPTLETDIKNVCIRAKWPIRLELVTVT